MKKLLLLAPGLFPLFLLAQTVNVKITLLANEGGFHANMPVSLVDTATKTTFKGTTDANGQVIIAVAPDAVYDLLIPNYTERKLIRVPNAPGATMSSTLHYSRRMVEEEKEFAMTPEEKGEVDRFSAALPDTTWLLMPDRQTWSDDYYSRIELELKNLDSGPLAGETVTVTGRKRKKSFKGTTGADGKLVMHLPKGDVYDVSFYYHKNFELLEVKYNGGTENIEWTMTYIGTKEYARKKKEKEERVAAEKIRQAQAQKAWEEELRRSSLSVIEKNKEDIKSYEAGKLSFEDDAALTTLKRNPQWKNKLIVCDVTGSMSPYMQQLMVWFRQERQKDPGVQFVFFNDADPSATLGGTRNWLYTATPVLDTLIAEMVKWNEIGDGGGTPENDVESLVMATRLAKKPFDEIILIADNSSPVTDMQFMPDLVALKKPVHVILCGSNGSFIEPDYLAIARNTKGSVHTSGADYFSIGNSKDGDKVTIGPQTFQLMKGEFIAL